MEEGASETHFGRFQLKAYYGIDLNGGRGLWATFWLFFNKNHIKESTQKGEGGSGVQFGRFSIKILLRNGPKWRRGRLGTFWSFFN
jgi:hypothetical protein